MSPAYLILTGPTASGKSELAIWLASKLPLEIISADSRMVYRGLDVGTDKPSAELREQIPHHLIDILPPGQPYSAADFVRHACSLVKEITRRSKLPLVVGGTLFYLAVLTGRLSLDRPPPLLEVRDALDQLIEEVGLEELARLAREHGVTVADPQNPRRLIRALEGEEWMWQHLHRLGLLEELPDPPPAEPVKPCPEGARGVVLTRPREVLRRLIEQRARRQFAGGLLDEARWLLSLGLPEDDPSMTGLGYREAIRHLKGELSLEQAIQENIRRNWRLARRQLAWLKSYFPDWPRIEIEEEELSDHHRGKLYQLAREVLEAIAEG